MCTCTHGLGQHYLDYAGPGICGAIPTRCLEEGCECKLYTPVVGQFFFTNAMPGQTNGPYYTPPSSAGIWRQSGY